METLQVLQAAAVIAFVAVAPWWGSVAGCLALAAAMTWPATAFLHGRQFAHGSVVGPAALGLYPAAH